MDELNGKLAIVTGGGRGLGEATCRCLAAAGATVVVADIDEASAEKVAASIEESAGRAVPTALDVTDPDSVERVATALENDHGAVDIVVNNAGTDVTVAFEDLSIGDWDRIMGVNLSGPFLMAKRFFPSMAARGSGHIVNIASTAAKRAWANATAYHASKWGLVGLSHALHVEARARGVKVTVIVSGGMRTPFLFERFPDLDPGLLQDPTNVAETIRFVVTQPAETVIPEVMVLPMRETSWP